MIDCLKSEQVYHDVRYDHFRSVWRRFSCGFIVLS
jgi:hypothetical protein